MGPEEINKKKQNIMIDLRKKSYITLMSLMTVGDPGT